MLLSCVKRIYDKVGPRPLLIPGAILLTAGAWSFSILNDSSPVGLVIALHIVFSIGMCLMMTPLMTTALGSLPRILYGHGSAILNTLQQLAGAACPVGNAAGAGTAVLLLDAEKKNASETLAAKAKNLELSTDPYFMDQYVEQMMFGNEDLM